MTTTCNNGNYAMYEKNMRGFAFQCGENSS